MRQHQEDLTDNWRDATDPDNRFGESCDGVFVELAPGFWKLERLLVQDTGGMSTLARRIAEYALTDAEVARLEREVAKEMEE